MSTEYWEKRHASAPNEYEASWEGDSYARALELQFIHAHLDRREAPWDVVELGCGGYTLDEGSPKHPHIAHYFGMDCSKSAIATAEKKKIPFPASFQEADITPDTVPRAYPNQLIICRRFIQNIKPGVRDWLFRYVTSFHHGIILECTIEGMHKTNQLRARNNLDPLFQPLHNYYLSASETGRLSYSPKVDVSWPLGGYYFLSRGHKNTKNDTEAYLGTAFRNHGFNFGPLQAWTWNLDT